MSEEWTPHSFQNEIIFDKEMDDWLATCPTHKYDVEYADDYGIHVCIRFDNSEEGNK